METVNITEIWVRAMGIVCLLRKIGNEPFELAGQWPEQSAPVAIVIRNTGASAYFEYSPTSGIPTE